jgi:electron transfer flavoprotein alpha subunit
MTNYKNVMIYAEVVDGKLATVTKELLGCGGKLAKDLGEELYAVLMGSGVSALANEVIAFGADKVYVIDNPLLKDYNQDLYFLSIAKIVQQEIPRIVILGHTPLGLDLCPRLAFRFNTATVLDCVELSIDPKTKLLLRSKPVYGGKALASYVSETYPQMATIRSKSMQPSERNDSRQGEIIPIDLGLDQSFIRARVLEKVIEEKEGIKLEDADVIVTGGRGIGSADGFRQLEELAKILKGAVGATRAVCDEGWAPTTIQVGLTGKIVSPKLYIAVALSGSSQHMAGCAGSETIVGINRDENANIFNEAKLGVVGDWKIVLPVMIQRIKSMLEK